MLTLYSVGALPYKLVGVRSALREDILIPGLWYHWKGATNVVGANLRGVTRISGYPRAAGATMSHIVLSVPVTSPKIDTNLSQCEFPGIFALVQFLNLLFTDCIARTGIIIRSYL